MKKKLNQTDEGNLPGYPHYPPAEDILNAGDEKVDADLETVKTGVQKNNPIESAGPQPEAEGTVPLVQGNESDVTAEDLAALGDENLSADGGDDEMLQTRTEPVDMAGEDLDIPGSELDDESEETGNEDEENNFYSLGGDQHD